VKFLPQNLLVAKLELNGTTFEIAKMILARTCDFLDLNEDLWRQSSYSVRSAVSEGVFRGFLEALEMNTKITVTATNAASLSQLPTEFSLPELSTATADKFMVLDPESISALGERLFNLEHEFSLLRANCDDMLSGHPSGGKLRFDS
jgi:hypothetical protein